MLMPIGYIGPGAGFAFAGSFLMLAAAAMGFVSIGILPLRLALRAVRRGRRGGARTAPRRRCVLIGLDGLDPRRAERLMDAGQLPHFERLRRTGWFSRLDSTCPPISPVAWSSFATGSNPGKHNIFDFLNRDTRTGIIGLSSTRVRLPTPLRRRRWPGRWRRRAAPEIALLRRGRPFWTLLGEHGLDAAVLRVPVTFPVEPCRGQVLAAMGTPDLRGTQGEFTLFDSHPEPGVLTGGRQIALTLRGDRAVADLPGPEMGGMRLVLPLTLRPLDDGRAILWKQGQP